MDTQLLLLAMVFLSVGEGKKPRPRPTAASRSLVEVQRAHEMEIPNFQLQGPFPSKVELDGFSLPSEESGGREGLHGGRLTGQPRQRLTTPIPILRLEKQQSIDGSYTSNYETGNSIRAENRGEVKNPGAKDELLVQSGSYSYIDPEGEVVQVSYTADEGGFRPVGRHLPTPPPVPPEVRRGLDIIFESLRREEAAGAKASASTAEAPPRVSSDELVRAERLSDPSLPAALLMSSLGGGDTTDQQVQIQRSQEFWAFQAAL